MYMLYIRGSFKNNLGDRIQTIQTKKLKNKILFRIQPFDSRLYHDRIE